MHWKKSEYVMPTKRDTKKSPFCMSSNKFFVKYSLQDNYWVGHSVTKPVGIADFQKIKGIREGDYESS